MKGYFPHDSDARSDDKIIALRIRHKWEGYGIYWGLIEKLRESQDYQLRADYNVLAFDLRADAAIIKSVINDFGLFAFTDNGECFYSESLRCRMRPLDERKAKLSEAGKKGNDKKWKGKNSPPDRHPTTDPSPPDRHPTTDPSPPDRHPIAQSSQDKIREEETIKEIFPSGNTKKAPPPPDPVTHPGFNPDMVERPLDECEAMVLQDTMWIEQSVCMQNHISMDQFRAYLDEFFDTLRGCGESLKSVKDAKSHFYRQLKIKLEKQRKDARNKGVSESDEPKRYGGY